MFPDSAVSQVEFRCNIFLMNIAKMHEAVCFHNQLA